MRLRSRKFIGAIALFVLVIVWALVAMALAQSPAIRDNSITSIVYYIVAGLGWVVPAMPLVRWMSGSGTTSQ
jgi:Na+-transporting NADH:ubiquinone oxidoreductase subunit NqrD